MSNTKCKMVPITLGGIVVHQDANGRFSLNDLHKAAGGERRHEPSEFLSNLQARELVSELETTGIPVVKKEGRHGGTYVCKELVYAYAMWISAKFHLQVIRTFDALATGDVEKAQEIARPTKSQTALDAMRRMKAAEIGMSLAEKIVTKFTNLGDAARQVITAKLVNSAMGEEVVPLPVLEYRTYSALEVGEKLNITANAVGRLANKHGLKIEQYGRYVLDKSQHSDKQVEAFRYNDAAVERMRDLLRDGGAIAPVKA